MRTIAPAIWYRWPYYRHWSTLPDDLLNRTLDELCDRDFRAIRATGSHWMQAVQRMDRWKAMWKRVRESLTWPLRNCFLQLELETSDTVSSAVDGEQRHIVKLDIPFQDVKPHMVSDSCLFTHPYDEIIDLRQMQGRLREFTVVGSARIYNKKSGRVYVLRPEDGASIKGPLEVETNRRSNRKPKEFEFRWCLDRGPGLRHAHVIEYVRDRLRDEVGCYLSDSCHIAAPYRGVSHYFGGGVEDDLRVWWDEAAAGEMMMEQTLMSQLHRLEFCLRLDHLNKPQDYPERGTRQEPWQGLEVEFSIKSVFPPPQRPKAQPLELPAYACFYDDVLSEHLQVAAILLLLGEPLPWFPPGGPREHSRRQADAAALATWLKKGSCRARSLP